MNYGVGDVVVRVDSGNPRHPHDKTIIGHTYPVRAIEDFDFVGLCVRVWGHPYMGDEWHDPACFTKYDPPRLTAPDRETRVPEVQS